MIDEQALVFAMRKLRQAKREGEGANIQHTLSKLGVFMCAAVGDKVWQAAWERMEREDQARRSP